MWMLVKEDISQTDVVFEDDLLKDIDAPRELCYCVVDSNGRFVGILGKFDYYFANENGKLTRHNKNITVGKACNRNAQFIISADITPQTIELLTNFSYIPVLTEGLRPCCFYKRIEESAVAIDISDEPELVSYMLRANNFVYVLDHMRFVRIIRSDENESSKHIMPVLDNNGNIIRIPPPSAPNSSVLRTLAYEPIEPAEQGFTINHRLPQSITFAKEILSYVQKAVLVYLLKQPNVCEVNIADVGGGVGIGSEYIRARL